MKQTDVLRISEVYPSIQGEGPRVGLPTTFIRFGGCNLRCAAWPCDTQHAINPKYRHEWKRISAEDLTLRALEYYPRNWCLTGGEPFLQRHEELAELCRLGHLHKKTIEAFTNGTILYPDWAIQYVNLVVDWKLPGSGEYKVNQEAREANIDKMATMPRRHVVKFTIADDTDYWLARDIWKTTLVYTDIPVYAGVVWGKLDNAKLVEWVLADQLPWKFTMQIHNHVWDRTQRGI